LSYLSHAIRPYKTTALKMFDIMPLDNELVARRSSRNRSLFCHKNNKCYKTLWQTTR